MPERVILDTNVWISGIIKGGKAGEVIGYLETHNYEVFISLDILAEIDRVLDYPRIKKILLKSGKSKIEVLKRIYGMCFLVRPQVKLQIVHEDPADNMFLECAQEVLAQYLISVIPIFLN
ncbi:putative toxin-antitoxin system toxin component, PIN family [Candidatus Aminicenantes bacterium AC-708-M15]|nr:putative toxin-antitoxin system toxin component, PIN family [SCandidatus Aminicenantes bacterium Aminicenantia_JdfR_composite]MCP2596823.1 putative toxin-antitoxin system toxin component, PIN family [Candidatus Aminicenantes bacterium AC-335-G13]MCP2604023.1 putative toxin-antitoxin system toxin component, PIN family [Candidatus Aminicenantes bacterium AC-708-M15]MCP2618484.1 putative toxin-antitoxin system toxin component, PIN family [Candidatus Aminicenantes bacterium AC-335-A11]MCP2620926